MSILLTLALAAGAAKVVNSVEDNSRKKTKKNYKKRSYKKNDSWLDLAWFNDHGQRL